MAATVWKGYISFGLISIPVRLFTAARDQHVSFHQLHAVCSTRIKQQLYCPHCDRTVERSEIVKGYEVSKGEWVEVEQEDIKKIAPASSETMEIQQFVREDDVDPIYLDSSYYVVPEEAGRRAYSLLVETLKTTQYAAVAKIAMHTREYIVIIRPRDPGLALHTIYYPNEVRPAPEFSKIETASLKPQEIHLAEQLVKSLAGPFKPQQYKDDYQEKLLELVEAKAEGRRIKSTPHGHKAPVIDLMQALKKSLGSAEKKPAAKATSRHPRPKRAAATKRLAS